MVTDDEAEYREATEERRTGGRRGFAASSDPGGTNWNGRVLGHEPASAGDVGVTTRGRSDHDNSDSTHMHHTIIDSGWHREGSHD